MKGIRWTDYGAKRPKSVRGVAHEQERKPGNSQVAKLVNNMILGITMNAVAEGLKLGSHYDLPQAALFELLKVNTGDSWVARNWGDISEWTADTALAVLLKDLKAAHNEGLKHSVALPFNALSSVYLFNAMGKDKPDEK
jgi:3-hydroxyisobutyrate dehydrogenase-like beta-hydroxyacid dehydrogenase